jgi:hypothetical protein
MDTMYLAASYLVLRARRLGQAVFRSEAGALSLEWIVIAVLVVGAATLGVTVLKSAISAEAKKLP